MIIISFIPEKYRKSVGKSGLMKKKSFNWSQRWNFLDRTYTKKQLATKLQYLTKHKTPSHLNKDAILVSIIEIEKKKK